MRITILLTFMIGLVSCSNLSMIDIVTALQKSYVLDEYHKTI